MDNQTLNIYMIASTETNGFFKRHHKEDVIVGSLIGFFTAATCYLIYWPNPFTSQGPRYVYNRLVTDRPEGNYEYELAGIEHADGTV